MYGVAALVAALGCAGPALGPPTPERVVVRQCAPELACGISRFAVEAAFGHVSMQELTATSECRVLSYVGDTYVSAGDVTVTAPGRTITVPAYDTPAGSAYSLFGAAGDAPWVSGDALGVAATGATVPAFSASLSFPDYARLSRPLPGDATMSAIPFDADLALSWTPIAHGEAWVGFELSCGSNQPWVTVAECVFAGSRGSGTVPAAILTRLRQAGTHCGARAGFNINTSFGGYAATTLSVGGHTIDVRALALSTSVLQIVPPQ